MSPGDHLWLPDEFFLFEGMGDRLPLITKLLMGLSRFFSHFWWVLFILLSGGAFLLYTLWKKEEWRLRFDQFILKIPVMGDLIVKTIFARFIQTLSLLLSNSVSILEAIQITQAVIQNRYIAKQFDHIHSSVVQGESLSMALQKADVFAPLMVNIITVGEETGRLEETLIKMNQTYKKDIQRETRRWMSLIEPSLVFIMAVIVGLMVMAVLLPILQMDMQVF